MTKTVGIIFDKDSIKDMDFYSRKNKFIHNEEHRLATLSNKKREELRQEARTRVREAIDDAVSQKEEQRLQDSIERRKFVLFAGKTKFPFDLFPNQVVIQVNKIIIKYHQFIKAEQIETYNISNFNKVIISRGPFTSMVRLVKESESGELLSELRIENLDGKDAGEMYTILYGMLMAKEEHVDLKKIDRNHLLSEIENLGRMQV